MQDPTQPDTPAAINNQRFTQHSRFEQGSLEVSDCTRRDGSDAIWIGHIGTGGQWVTPEEAWKFCRAIAEAAQANEDRQRDKEDESELARYNAGPINRIELPGGVVAFEPMTEGGAA